MSSIEIGVEKIETSIVSEIRSDELKMQLIGAGITEEERVITGSAISTFKVKKKQKNNLNLFKN